MQTGLPVATYVLATTVLWAASAAIAGAAALALVTASLHRSAAVRLAGETAITLTRGVPTSLAVITAGILSSRLPPAPWLPDVFPGTLAGLQSVAWAVTAALALGSAGHLAVVFRAAHAALGRHRIDQATVLGLSPLRRAWLLGGEAALVALPPTSARLVHHLHNTAFAALFPVADLFGWVQDRASATFDVTTYALAGAAIYAALSGCIWLGGRALELRLAMAPGARRAGGAAA